MSGGYWSEGRERLERLLARPEAAEHTRARAAALNLAGDLAIQQNDLQAAWAVLDESQAIGLELGEADKPYLGWSLMLLGQSLSGRDRAAAQRAYDESIVLLHATGETCRLAITLFMRGYLAGSEGDFALACNLFSESLLLLRNIDDRFESSLPTYGLGWVFYSLGDYNAARSYLQEALAILRAFGDKKNRTGPPANPGAIALLQGEYEEAPACFDERLEIARELGGEERVALAPNDRGIAAGQLGDYVQATALLRAALPLCHGIDNLHVRAIYLLGMAGIQQQPQRAAQMLAATQTAFEASGEFIEPLYRTELERIERVIRTALGEGAFAVAWAEGRGLTQDQAIEYAFEV